MPGMFDRLQSEIEGRERQARLSPVDLLELPDEGRRVVQLLARRGELPDPEIAAALGASAEDLAGTLDELAVRGFILRRELHGVPHCRTYFGRRRGRDLPVDLWSALAEKTRGDAGPGEAGPGGPEGA